MNTNNYNYIMYAYKKDKKSALMSIYVFTKNKIKTKHSKV